MRKHGSAVGSLDLTDVEGIETGWHAGLDEPPLDYIAIAHQGAEGKDKDIFHGVTDEGIALVIEFFHQVHTFPYHFKLMFQRHALCEVCQYLNGLVGGGGNICAVDLAAHLRKLAGYEGGYFELIEHMGLFIVRMPNEMPDHCDAEAKSMECAMGKGLARRPAGWLAIGVGFVHTGMETNYQNRGVLSCGPFFILLIINHLSKF
jgi:hypothetical protein